MRRHIDGGYMRKRISKGVRYTVVSVLALALAFPGSFAWAKENEQPSSDVPGDSRNLPFKSDELNSSHEAVVEDDAANEGGGSPSFQESESDNLVQSDEQTIRQLTDSSERPVDNTANGFKENSWRYDNGEAINAGDGDSTALLALPQGVKAVGIDVSAHQASIDWAKVKQSGIDYAILRCGYARGVKDDRFAENVKGCMDNDIPFGVYLYSYAWDAESARMEAEGALDILRSCALKPGDLTFPVYYDIENTVGNENHPDYGKPAGVDDDNQYRVIQGGAATFAAMGQAFCSVIEEAGFKPGVYSNTSWWNTHLSDPCFDSWDRWVAQYYLECQYAGPYSMWQHTSSATVPGISGPVDANYYYGNVLDADAAVPHVDYRAHTAKYGWLDQVSDGAMAGTKGEYLRMEALEFSLRGGASGSGIRADALVEGDGWQGWATGTVGTTGRYKEMQALKVELTGPVAEEYDVWYRAQCEHYGWLGWAKNGEAAGTEGYGYRMEAVQIVLRPKGSAAPGGTSGAFMVDTIPHVDYRAHTAKYGWLGQVSDGAMAGTKGEYLRMEALEFSLRGGASGSGIRADALVEGDGWQGWATGTVGTTGRYKEMQALKVELTGPVAEEYDVWYRAQCEHYGWLGWAKNGEAAGTEGYGYRMEAVQIVLRPKGSAAPGGTSGAFMVDTIPHVDYRAHTAKYGWLGQVSDGAMAGTKGEGLRLEAFEVSSRVSGVEVLSRSYVSGSGWQDWVNDGIQSGTTGQYKAVEGIQLKLQGSKSSSFDIWYRVQMQTYGWLDWAKSGDIAGAPGLGKNVEAIAVVLMPKGKAPSGSIRQPAVTLGTVTYSAISHGNAAWGPEVTGGATAGTAGKALPMTGFKVSYESHGVSGGISYAAHTATHGWLGAVSNGAVAGVPSEDKQVEAVRIALSGDASKYFDVWYRVNIKDYGWLGWVKNGAIAGSTGCGLRAEGLQVVLKAKNSSAPGSTKWGGFVGKESLPYIGHQNPSSYYQLSNKTVAVKNAGSGIFGYASPCKLAYNATRNQAVNAMIARAIDYMGTPYVWDYSCAPGIGVDCAGLVMQSLYAVGMDVSPMNPWDHFYTPGHDHYANDMRANRRIKKVSFSERKVGDLILTNGHVSIYIGSDRIIEAWPRVGVRQRSVYGSTPILAVGRPIV